MQAQDRSPARFIVEGHSSAFRTTVVWKIDVGKKGIVAKCQTYKRHVSISWEDLWSMAMTMTTTGATGGRHELRIRTNRPRRGAC